MSDKSDKKHAKGARYNILVTLDVADLTESERELVRTVAFTELGRSHITVVWVPKGTMTITHFDVGDLDERIDNALYLAREKLNAALRNNGRKHRVALSTLLVRRVGGKD